MTRNERTSEGRIANDPPVPPRKTRTRPDTTEVHEPPSTELLIEGFEPDELTPGFLRRLKDLADDHGLPVETISVDHPEWDDG